MALSFEIYEAESGAFVFPFDLYQSVSAALGDLVDGHATGGLSDKTYVSGLDKLIAQAPDFVDAHAYLAIFWYATGKPKKALDAALRGLAIANQQIPESFSGRIEWGHLDNRPYLRSMHVALLAYMRLRRHKDAVVLIDLMLARNPNDNQGVRYLLGSEAMRAGDYQRARSVFEAEAENYPPYQYELALCCMFLNDWIGAATALRRGFVSNPYIAEILGGHPNPARLAGIWHGSNLAEPETAHDYVGMFGMLWQENINFLPCVRWLFNHSKVLKERAALMECREMLAREDDQAKRKKILADEVRLIAAIDNSLSETLMLKRMDQYRKVMAWPWA